MNARFFLVTGLVLFGGAVYGLHSDKMRVTTVCRDARLYMDGGIDAEIEAGGLNYHHDAKLFRRTNNKDVYLASFQIDAETGSQAPAQILQAGSSLKLTVYKNQKPTIHGFPGHLDAEFKGEKISVNVNCAAKNI